MQASCFLLWVYYFCAYKWLGWVRLFYFSWLACCLLLSHSCPWSCPTAFHWTVRAWDKAFQLKCWGSCRCTLVNIIGYDGELGCCTAITAVIMMMMIAVFGRAGRAHGLVRAAGHGCGLRIGDLLGISLHLQLVYQLLSRLVSVVARVIQPLVPSDLICGRPEASIVRKQSQYEILESIWKVITVNFRKIGVQPPIQNQTVEILLLPSLLEREYPLHNDE